MILFAMMTAGLSALPFMNPDGVTVPSDDPRIGAVLYVIPGTSWNIYSNDNPPPSFGDRDFNDGWANVTFDLDGSGVAKWLGSNSAMDNSYLIAGKLLNESNPLISLIPQTINNALHFKFVTEDGKKYGNGHFNNMVEQVTPEPTSMIMIGLGLMFVAYRRKS